MAIGSEAPIGESFTRLRVVDGFIDQEQYAAWAKAFHEKTKNNLLDGEATVRYSTAEQKEAFRKRIAEEYCVHGTGCCSVHR
jgi:hypothetical protein